MQSGEGKEFVGGGGNIAIATAPPPSFFVYCIVNIKQFMEFLYVIFSACVRFRFLDVETNTGRRRYVPAVGKILCSEVRGLAGILSDLTVASSRYHNLLCSETLWYQICITTHSCWFPDLVTVLLPALFEFGCSC